MPLYTVHYVDRGDQIWHSMQIEFESDEEAIRAAHASHSPPLGHGFDVYEESRLVHRHRGHSVR